MSLEVLTMGGGGEAASIFVTGLSETDVVTAEKDGKTVNGVWTQKLVYGENLVNEAISITTANNGNIFVRDNQTVVLNYAVEKDTYFFLPLTQTLLTGKPYTVSFDCSGIEDGTAMTFLVDNKTDNPIPFKNGRLSCTFTPIRDISNTLLIDDLASSWVNIIGKEIVLSNFKIQEQESVYGHEISPIKSYGTWTVTATNGEQTATQDVLVDAALAFEIEMGYILWLYREGDECEGVTGGWYVEQTGGDHAPILTKETNRLRIQAPIWCACDLLTAKTVETTGHTRLCVDYSVSGIDAQYAALQSMGRNIITGGSIAIQSPASLNIIDGHDGTFWLNISNTGNGYIYINNIWLE